MPHQLLSHALPFNPAFMFRQRFSEHLLRRRGSGSDASQNWTLPEASLRCRPAPDRRSSREFLGALPCRSLPLPRDRRHKFRAVRT
jgi:hypothetical protein